MQRSGLPTPSPPISLRWSSSRKRLMPLSRNAGVSRSSISMRPSPEREREKVTYESMFYRTLESGKYVGTIKGFPITRAAQSWCKHLKFGYQVDLRKYILSHPEIPEGGGATESTASRWSRGIGARAISSNGLCNKVDSVLHRGTQSTSLAYGFPISVNRGNWCTALKQRVFRQHPGTRCGDKYCAIPRNSRR